MAGLTPWREAVALPVITGETQWDLTGLETVLTEAIQRCVSECRKRKGVICLTLSGGLDSSFCLAKVRRLVGPGIPIHTFTTGGSERHPDIQFARMVSRRFGTVHHELIPSREAIRVAEQELIHEWGDDEPHEPGDVAVFMTYQHIGRRGFGCVIAHDGVDELLGGYWGHRQYDDERRKAAAFQRFWGELTEKHLLPLEKKARRFGVRVVLPYLQEEVVRYIAGIPLGSRTSRKESKIPLRTIARPFLPKEVLRREKKGFCGALDEE